MRLSKNSMVQAIVTATVITLITIANVLDMNFRNADKLED
tara:strand:- start:729 stop:848 length:120 start_codon:yes stop_codon:yes gene_type:complete